MPSARHVLAILAVAARWVFLDAGRHRMQRGLWACATFLTGPVGVLLYLGGATGGARSALII